MTTSTGIIAMVPDSWRASIRTTRHHVLSRLAGYFEVVWVEPAIPWREAWLPAHRRRADNNDQSHAATGGERDHPCDVIEYNPGRWLPEIHRPRWLRRWIQRQRLRGARRLLEARGCDRIVLYLWRPRYAWTLDALPLADSCYHIDDEYSFATDDEDNSPGEVALIRRAGRVLIHSPRLLQKKGRINPHTYFLPNGVDYGAYTAVTTPPPDLEALPSPRIGYVGVIKAQLDLELLLELARRRPQWSWVLVGPVGFIGDKAPVMANLSAMPNVHFLGRRPLTQLPAYTQHLDVCLMPYTLTDYTNFINPLKLYEYLAAGPPIVSTPIDSVRPFADVVQLAGSVGEWEHALQRALEPRAGSAAARARRRQRAARFDWDLLVAQIVQHLREPPARESSP
ncbi:MAG: glycosyltransferase [Proteobacteria bacterium]|nr:glycosyltransferase [Pseudomonadota bacterium]